MADSLEIDLDVLRYRSQPFAISVGRRRYVPDFVAEHHDGTYTVIDVKPEGRLSDPKVAARMRSMRSTLKKALIPHQLITEVQLERQPALQIRECLRKASSLLLPKYERGRLLALLDVASMTVAEFRRRVVEAGYDPLFVEKLALLGDLTFPITTQWSGFAQLEINHGTDSTATAGRGTVHSIRITL